MKLIRDEAQHVAFASDPWAIWALIVAVGLSPLGVVAYCLLNDQDWHIGMYLQASVFPAAVLVIYALPRLLVSVDRREKKLCVQRTWPWGRNVEEIAFGEIKGIASEIISGKYGPGYRPMLTLRNGKVRHLSHGNGMALAPCDDMVQRIGTILNAEALGDGRRTGEGPRQLPIEVGTVPMRAPVKFAVVLAALGVAALYYGAIIFPALWELHYHDGYKAVHTPAPLKSARGIHRD